MKDFENEASENKRNGLIEAVQDFLLEYGVVMDPQDFSDGSDESATVYEIVDFIIKELQALSDEKDREIEAWVNQCRAHEETSKATNIRNNELQDKLKQAEYEFEEANRILLLMMKDHNSQARQWWKDLERAEKRIEEEKAKSKKLISRLEEIKNDYPNSAKIKQAIAEYNKTEVGE